MSGGRPRCPDDGATQSLRDSAELLRLLGDPTRMRLLSLLGAHELTVAELTAITELAQSRVSTHLGKLRDAGVLRDRRHGASTFYRVREGDMPPSAERLLSLLREQLRDGLLEQDRERCRALLEARHGGRWPDTIAGRMERHYSPGRTWESLARAMMGLVRLGDVLDVGCGDGTMAQMLAPRARAYTGLDRSEGVVAAARARCAGATFVVGDMHALPFDDARFDEVLALHVLTSTQTPAAVLSEIARVLRPGGRLLVQTLRAHRHLDLTRGYGHVSAGFDPDALAELLGGAGLEVGACEVVARERRKPHFEVLSAIATRKPR